MPHDQTWGMDVPELGPLLANDRVEVGLILGAANPGAGERLVLEERVHEDTVGASSDVNALDGVVVGLVLGHHLGLGGNRLREAAEENQLVGRQLLVWLWRQHIREEEFLAVLLPILLVAKRAREHTQLHCLASPVLALRAPEVALEVLKHALARLHDEGVLNEQLVDVDLEGSLAGWVHKAVVNRQHSLQEGVVAAVYALHAEDGLHALRILDV